jgi:hypothetical protein
MCNKIAKRHVDQRRNKNEEQRKRRETTSEKGKRGKI